MYIYIATLKWYTRMMLSNATATHRYLSGIFAPPENPELKLAVPPENPELKPAVPPENSELKPAVPPENPKRKPVVPPENPEWKPVVLRAYHRAHRGPEGNFLSKNTDLKTQ